MENGRPGHPIRLHTTPYQGDMQVNPPRMSTQGLKPPKWDEHKTPLSKWLQELVLFLRLTQAPRQQWGWIGLNTLDEGPKHSLLAQLSHTRGVNLNAEAISQPDFVLTWAEFKTALETLYGHKCTDAEIRAQIAAFTKPGTSGSDTLKYMQLLEQMFLKCEHSMDDYSKLTALFTGLRTDLREKCLLDNNENQWQTYTALRAHLFKIAPTYDAQRKNTGHSDHLGARSIVRKHHTLKTDRRGLPIISQPPRNVHR